MRIESSGEFDDWTATGMGLVWICSDLFEGIFTQVPPAGRLRAEILARALCEYAITFAWIAAAESDDERAIRLKRFEKEEFVLRRKAERQLLDHIAVQDRYKHLFEAGRLPNPLLDDAVRARVDALEADASIKRLPDALQMARVADERWMEEIGLVRHNPFAAAYFVIFTTSSFTTHASVSAIAKVISGTAPDLIVGAHHGLGESAGPYGMTIALIANVLFVMNRVFGIPPNDAIIEAVNTA